MGCGIRSLQALTNHDEMQEARSRSNVKRVRILAKCVQLCSTWSHVTDGSREPSLTRASAPYCRSAGSPVRSTPSCLTARSRTIFRLLTAWCTTLLLPRQQRHLNFENQADRTGGGQGVLMTKRHPGCSHCSRPKK